MISPGSHALRSLSYFLTATFVFDALVIVLQAELNAAFGLGLSQMANEHAGEMGDPSGAAAAAAAAAQAVAAATNTSNSGSNGVTSGAAGPEISSSGGSSSNVGSASTGAGSSSPKDMPKRLHVSNIPFRFRDPDLRAMFGVST